MQNAKYEGAASGSKLAEAAVSGNKFSSIKFLHLAVIFLVTACVVFPLTCVLITPRLKDFIDVFSSSVWRTAMLNTLLECISSTTLSVMVGYLFAYAVIKADIPFKKIFAFFPILHLMTPPFVGGLSFILLFGRQGFITKTLLGLDVSLYGFPGLLIAQVLCFFPIAYLICSQVLKRVPPSLEQAARAMGASKARIALTVTLPLCANGILSAALFIAVSVLSDFGNPMIVAGRFRVLAVEVVAFRRAFYRPKSLYERTGSQIRRGWLQGLTPARKEIFSSYQGYSLYLLCLYFTIDSGSVRLNLNRFISKALGNQYGLHPRAFQDDKKIQP